MKIENYLKSLLPNFEKDQIIEDCRITRSELKETTIPAYQSAVHLLKTWKFKSEKMEQRIASWNGMVKGGGGNIIVAIDKGLPVALENLHAIESLVERAYNEDIAGAGLTFMKTQVLQFVEVLGFVSKFARKFLIYAYVCETAGYEEGGTTISDSLAPAEIEWIETNFVSFCQAFNVATGHPNDVSKKIAEIPDIVVTEDNLKTLPATLGTSKVDPLMMGFIPVWLNPIYHIGMRVAEWQARRYNAAKEELKLLQLRRLNLERLAAGKPDAKLQKEITYLEGRIQGLNYDIAKMEKKYE